MTHDIHVWGDSHWRNFLGFVNHGPPGVTAVHGDVRMIDAVANELSGATMYGLLNENSKNGARRRILEDLDELGGVDNVALVFGEVDCRYPQHHDRYFWSDGTLKTYKVIDLLARYRQFIDEDLVRSGRVRGFVFVYFGFAYPQGVATLLQPGQPIGEEGVRRARLLERAIRELGFDQDGFKLLVSGQNALSDRVVPIVGYPSELIAEGMVSADGVHHVPELIFPQIILPTIRHTLGLDPPFTFPIRPELPL